MILIFLHSLCLALATSAAASTAESGNLYVSTIAAQSDGIFFSSGIILVSGSSLTLQGSKGYLVAESSITASSFFGDGGRLGQVASLSGDNIFSGANMFTSSFTIQSYGRPIVLSTSIAGARVEISSGGALSFFPELHNSSSTVVPEATSTGSFGPCIAGSTISIVTSGGRVEVTFTGALGTSSTSGSPGDIAINFLQDGSFVRDLSATKGFVANGTSYSYASYMPFRLNYLVDAPSTGSHSYCLTIQGGTILSGDNSRNLFYVKEIK